MSFNFQIDSQVKVYATSGAFPATGVIRTIYIDKSSDTAYYWDDATSTYKSLGGGGSGSVVWGAITGTLADQTDLQNALNAKVPYSGATGNVDLGEYQIKAGQLELDQTPTGTTGIAKIRWNDTDGTIDVGLKGGNVTLQVGLEELVRVVNKSGASLAESAYQAVRVRLVSEGGASGQRLAVVLAQANNDLNSATTIGIVTETIANNQEGFINRGGEVRGINTTGSLQGETWVDGDILYLSPTTPGALTNIKPTAPNHSITIGYVVYSHAVNGKIFVKVDNGYELEELHNVTSTDYTAPVDADSLLIYQSSESLWKRLTWANVKAKLKTYFDTVYQDAITPGTTSQYYRGDKTFQTLDKTTVGLGNVDNTSDLNKPISTATQTALNAKQNTLTLTTTGTSGAATLVGATLNIPQYSGGGGATYPKKLANSFSGVQVVGQVVLISDSLLIPANTITDTNFVLQINASLYRTYSGAGGGVLGWLYLNTTNTLVGATLIGRSGQIGSGQQWSGFIRNFPIKGTVGYGLGTGNQFGQDFTSNTGFTFTFDKTQNIYLIFAISSVNVNDGGTWINSKVDLYV